MANGVSVTPEREEKYDFTEPYAYNRIVVITTADSDIASMEDLEGKTTANTLGSSYATLAESFGATNTAWTTSTRPSSCSRAVASTRP